MQTQSTKYNLKRFLLTGALIASMPIVMGNGGCTTTESFMNEMSTASFGMNSQIKRREASIELRRGNIEKSNKAYAQSVGYGTLYRMGETGSERNYNSAEAEKDRQALIQAANIQAQAERDAARIRTSSNVAELPSSNINTGIKEALVIEQLPRGDYMFKYRDGVGNTQKVNISERYNKINNDDVCAGSIGTWKVYNNTENGLYLIIEKE